MRLTNTISASRLTSSRWRMRRDCCARESTRLPIFATGTSMTGRRALQAAPERVRCAEPSRSRSQGRLGWLESVPAGEWRSSRRRPPTAPPFSRRSASRLAIWPGSTSLGHHRPGHGRQRPLCASHRDGGYGGGRNDSGPGHHGRDQDVGTGAATLRRRHSRGRQGGLPSSTPTRYDITNTRRISAVYLAARPSIARRRG